MFVCPKCGETFPQSRGLFWHFIEEKPCAKFARERGGTSAARYEHPGKAPLVFPEEAGSGIHAGPLVAMLLAGALVALGLAIASLHL